MGAKIDYNLLKLLPFELRVEIEENRVRDDLKQSEIAECERQLIKELEKHTKPGKRTDLTSVSRETEVEIGRSTEQVGKIFGESKDTVHRRLAIVEAAEEDPEKFKPIAEEMDETGNVNAAYKQMKLIKAKEEVKRQQSVEPDPNAPIVDLAKCREWIEKQPRCDLLLTDPPYITDIKEPIEKFVLWILPALEKVKPTGRAYVFIGSYPREILAYLKTFYEYRSLFDINVDLISLLAWTYRNTLGPKPKDNYIQNYQTILYFKGKEAPPLNCPLTNEQWSVQDINAPDGRSGKRYHTWQKPDELAERLIRHSTREGNLVLDPFVGTGTFVLMAAKFGRVARGCDIDHEMLLIAKERGCQYEG